MKLCRVSEDREGGRGAGGWVPVAGRAGSPGIALGAVEHTTVSDGMVPGKHLKSGQSPD